MAGNDRTDRRRSPNVTVITVGGDRRVCGCSKVLTAHRRGRVTLTLEDTALSDVQRVEESLRAH